MTLETLRHYLRYVVNIVALVSAVVARPEFGEFVSPAQLAMILAIVAAANTVLSWLRKV